MDISNNSNQSDLKANPPNKSLCEDQELLSMIRNNAVAAAITLHVGRQMISRYLINKCFWNIGQYIQKQINDENQLLSVNDLFFRIYANIIAYLNPQPEEPFSPKNLQRCYKLVELSDESWYDNIAFKQEWNTIADAIDHSESKEEFIGKFQ